MKKTLFTIGLLSLVTTGATQARAETGHKVLNVGTRPESVTRGFGGKWFITVMNANDKPGDGVVKVIDKEEVRDFATGLDEPKGLCFTGKVLVATDLKRVWKIDEKGEKTVLAEGAAFPHEVSYLNDAACEAGGKSVLVTDMGANTKMRDPKGALWPLDSAEAKALPAIGRVYRIGVEGPSAGKAEVVVDANAQMPCPNGVSSPAKGRVLVGEFFTGNIIEFGKKGLAILATGVRGADAIEDDGRGNLYISSWTQGKVFKLAKGKKEPEIFAEGFQAAADFYLDRKGKQLVLPDMKAGTLNFLPLK